MDGGMRKEAKREEQNPAAGATMRAEARACSKSSAVLGLHTVGTEGCGLTLQNPWRKNQQLPKDVFGVGEGKN